MAATAFMAVSAALAAKGYVDQQKAGKEAKRAAEQQQQTLEAMKRETPEAMPDADAQARARRRSIAGQLGRRGRASTILTSGSDATSGDPLGT